MKMIACAAAGMAALLISAPAFADSTEGTVVAFDRVAKRLVMKDKAVYSLGGTEVETPETLTAGDRVAIEFLSPGDDGISKIVSITILDDE